MITSKCQSLSARSARARRKGRVEFWPARKTSVSAFAERSQGLRGRRRGRGTRRGREVTRRRARDVMSAAIEHDVTVVAIGLPLPPTSSARRLRRRAAPRAHTSCGCSSLHRPNLTCLSLAHPARLDCDRPAPEYDFAPWRRGIPPAPPRSALQHHTAEESQHHRSPTPHQSRSYHISPTS